MTIYEKVKTAGLEYDTHESDLYVKDGPEIQELLKDYKYRSNVTGFISNIDKKRWLDIPFAFDPWWDRAERIAASWTIQPTGERK